MPVGTKATKAGQAGDGDAIFSIYSLGVATNRDDWTYDFDANRLADKVRRLIRNYNAEVMRWKMEGAGRVDEFVNDDPSFIKWTDRLKEELQKGTLLKFDEAHVRHSVYRPFGRQYLYFDHLLNQRRYQQHILFPTPACEVENWTICVSGVGSSKPFHALVVKTIPNLDLLEKTQCFPYYVYDEDGSNRRENITDWALARFREAYGLDVTKRDIFHYVYGLLHHPAYRERYAENLKRELPRIPLVESAAAFQHCAETGRRLMELHLSYEKQTEYLLRWVEHREGSPDGRVTFRVDKKMKLSPDRSTLIVNDTLTLEGIPPECFEYRLGNRSALEWVIDQYHVDEDKRSGITSDPNRADDPQYIVRLVGQVVTVSAETVRLVRALAAGVALPEPAAVEVAAN